MAGPGNTDLTWTNTDPLAVGVVVERKDGAGSFVDLPASKTTGTMKTTKDLTTVVGKQYTYRARFWNTALPGGAMQYGPYSLEATVTYPLAAPTAAPSGLSVA